MLGTITRDSTWRDLSPFCCKIPEGLVVLIINNNVTIRTKLAYFSSVIGSPEFFHTISISTNIRHFHPLDYLRSHHCLLGPFPLRASPPCQPLVQLPLFLPLAPQGLHCCSA